MLYNILKKYLIFKEYVVSIWLYNVYEYIVGRYTDIGTAIVKWTGKDF